MLLVQAIARLLPHRQFLSAGSLPQQSDGTLDIMAAQKIHHCVEVLFWIILAQAFQPPTAGCAVRPPQKEIHDMLPEGVVHGRVHFPSAKILPLHIVGNLVGSILPNLANEDGIGIRRLELFVKRPREFRRQLIHDIQPPSANPPAHPMMEHAFPSVDDEIHIRCVRLPHIRQGCIVPPGIVFLREPAEPIPSIVGRILGLIGAYGIIQAFPVEIAAVASRMAEHSFQKDADAKFLRLENQMPEVLIGPENRIDSVIVPGIVMMAALRLKDRIQADGGNTKFLQIRKLRLNALEIPSKKVTGNGLLRIRFPAVEGIVLPTGMVHGILFPDDFVSFTAKPIRENLIHNGVLEPLRRFRSFFVDRNLIGRRHMVIQLANAAELLRIIAVVEGSPFCRDDEIIPEQAALLRHFQLQGIKMHLAALLPGLQGKRQYPLP